MDLFSQLPEGCISDILSFTSPRDVCRSAAVSPLFKLASDSDSVWEAFLPSDYREIVSRSLSPVVFPTKKQLFLSLANTPILLDDGSLSFGIDRESGKKCYMLAARSLTIIWAHTLEHWKWKNLPESRFSEVALLNMVCWLEIKGRMDTRFLSPKTTYVAYLVYKIDERNNGLDGLPSKASVRFVVQVLEDEDSIVYLKEPSSIQHQHQRQWQPRIPRNYQYRQDGRIPRNRLDGWKEIELGEFFNDDDNSGEVEMRLLGTDGYHWKSGLIVEGIELRPKADT